MITFAGLSGWVIANFQPTHHGVWDGSDLQSQNFSRGVSADEERWLLERLYNINCPVGARRDLLNLLEKHAFAVSTAVTHLSTALAILLIYIHCLSLIGLVRDYSIIWACNFYE